MLHFLLHSLCFLKKCFILHAFLIFLVLVCGLSTPRNPPPKWSRRSLGGLSATTTTETFFLPSLSQSLPTFDFSDCQSVHRVSAKKRLGVRGGGGSGYESLPALATVTILPDPFGDEDFESVRMFTSLRMVADVEEEANKRQRNKNAFNRLGHRRNHRRRLGNMKSSRGDVWDRLG
uniref:Corticotropin-releasing factor domain-containing protein n=1 Tax=Mesocestoides corti TaxID=53468 RepID=A0A5K3G4P1_MESCO